MTDIITTTEALVSLVEDLRRHTTIAIDTEADSFFHYVDKLCLVQIAHGDRIALIDPLALPPDGLLPLGEVLADPGIRKIFHAADYDLYVLQKYGGLKIRNLFDTMISAQLLGYRAVGLAALVQQHFDVELAKDQQRTDWSRRPLRPAQLDYAAADVRYLSGLADLLENDLRERGRLAWAQAEFAALEDKVWPEREFDSEGYLRIKGARQLPPRARAILRELFLMRDARARERDRPPFKVLGNGTLMDLAQRPPRSKRSLAERRGITELVIRRLGNDILDAIERGSEAEIDGQPEPKPAGPVRRRLDRRAEQRLEGLKRWRAHRAKELDLDPGVFCPNAALEEIAASAPAAADDLATLGPVKSWWVDAFGEEVLEELASIPITEEEKPRPPRPGRSGRSGRRGRSRKLAAT
jgi:ribonuclease D